MTRPRDRNTIRCARGETDETPAKEVNCQVQKVIKSHHPTVPEKAELAIDGADELYKEIRIENRLTDEKGKETRLKEGAEVDVQIEADEKATDEKQ